MGQEATGAVGGRKVESDAANTKFVPRPPMWAVIVKEIGFPAAVCAFLLWDRLNVMEKFNQTMLEVKYAITELRHEMKVRADK